MKNSLLRFSIAAVLAAYVGFNPARAGSVARVFFDGDATGSDPTVFRQSVSTLTNTPAFPQFPDFREQLDDWSTVPGRPLTIGLQGKDNSGVDYGTWIRGYLQAPVTGQYLFGVASGDNSQLYLSTNYDPANEVLIAYEPGTGETLFAGDRLDTRVSAPIYLVQGQEYFFEVLQQVGAGPGYIQVGWQRPGGVQEIIPALHLAQYEVDNFLDTDHSGQAPIFNAPFPSNPGGLNGGNLPASVSLGEGQELLLQLDVIAPQPTTFVWKTNGVVVPGQNLSYFQLPRVPATYDGISVQAFVSNAYGTLASATTTVSVASDPTPPTVLTVDTAGNPNLVEILFSKPVDPASATNTANYQVGIVGGGLLTNFTAAISADNQTVALHGAFNFALGANYLLTVANILDQASTPNTLSPNPSTSPFVFSAPLGNTYHFDSGPPADFKYFGNAYVTNNPSANGGGLLSLTDAQPNENGAVLLTARQDIDQAHISFTTRISDGASESGIDQPGDGLSVNISANLPLGTFGSPEYGYAPPVIENQFTVYFNAHADSDLQPVAIGVSLNDVVLTNILAGTNGLPLDGVPPITSLDGHWAPVDINLLRDGTLNLAFDGVVVLTNFQTGWVGIPAAQVGFAAATRTWYETHWIDDLYINFAEGDYGDAGLSTNSVLGGTFPEGSPVSLVAVPTGAGPDTYQWYENGQPLLDATNRTLTFPGVVGAGGSFYVTVSNQFSGFASQPQTVYVQPNLSPATVTSVSGIAGGVNEVLLAFNQTLDPATATAVSTYSSPYFAVTSAILGQDGRSVLLHTTQQRLGVVYPLAITGLKDSYSAANILSTNLTFTSTLTYDDEVLADTPVRYYKLNETNGTVAFTETTGGDTLNTNGAYQNLPVLGNPSLLPDPGPDDYSALFISDHTNQVAVPNNGDINVLRGPFPKRTIELWFNAVRFPIGAQPGDSAVNAQTHAVSGLWEEGGNLRDIALYLWNNTGLTNPATGFLTFTAYNSTDDGPGSPFGLLLNPPVYITYPVSTNVTYHVVAILDGDPNGTNGELRLYVNSDLVGRTTNGVGQIYNHNGAVHIGGGNGRSHLNVSGLFGYFDGQIEDVAIYDEVLATNRILAHYQAATGASLTSTAPPTFVTGADTYGDPNSVEVVFNQPVSAQSAGNLANYALSTSGHAVIPIQSAALQPDLKTVKLSGAFNFVAGSAYTVAVQGVADILDSLNVVASTNLSFVFQTAGPVGIDPSSSLGNQTVTENQTAQFTVVATGQPPFTYQWLTNGVAWAGQTNSTLAFQAAWNSGGSYSVVVSNGFSSIASAPDSVLTVVPDQTPPQLVEVTGLAGTLNEIVLVFNKPVDPASAGSLATYNAPGLTLLRASVAPGGLQVTLATSPQTHGQTNLLAIRNLRDLAHVPNELTATVSFVSTISYRDEVLAEPGIVRYFTFDQTNGVEIPSLVSKYDTSPLNIVGTVRGNPTFPVLGVPGLVPNVPNNTAIEFTGIGGTNRVDLPNGNDIDASLGPWAQVTHIFAFQANGLPQVTVSGSTTNTDAPVLYSDYQLAFYILPTQASNNPAGALLVFEAQNTSSSGPGSPWGGNTPATAKYISYPIQPGVVYNVVGVLDGNVSFTGELRLYINGVRVGTVTGIGEVYNNPNDPPAFGQGYLTTYLGVGETINPELVTATTHYDPPFNGVIDEFALINQGVLTDERIAQLYAFSQTNWAGNGFTVVSGSGAPSISGVQIQSGNVVITWGDNSQLQRAASVTGPYVTLPNATSPYSEAVPTSGQAYFRLSR
jgi:hypothetical protein